MLSLLLPMGRYSFFAHACLHNIAETYGGNCDLSDLDVVILVGGDLNESLSTNLQVLKNKFKFRIVRTNFDSNLHLDLLDWAFRNVELNDWVIIQHCDFFWIEENWLKRFEGMLDSDYFAIRHDCGYTNFIYNNKDVDLLHDYFCIYNKQKLLYYDMKFSWGYISDLSVSPEALKAITEGRFVLKKIKPYWLDGSEAISIECAVHDLHIKTIPLHFYHVWQFFRIIDHAFEIKDNVLYVKDFFDSLINDQDRLSHYVQCSLICSKFISAKEIGSFLPWVIFEKLIQFYCKDKRRIEFLESNINLLERYRCTDDVYGDSDLGIKKIVFNDRSISYPSLRSDIKLL